MFVDHPKPELAAEDLFFNTPPAHGQVIPTVLNNDEIVDLNMGQLSLQVAIASNAPYLTYERWIFDMFIKKERIQTYGLPSISALKDKLTNKLADEWKHIQDLKLRAWEIQSSLPPSPVPTWTLVPPPSTARTHSRDGATVINTGQ